MIFMAWTFTHERCPACPPRRKFCRRVTQHTRPVPAAPGSCNSGQIRQMTTATEAVPLQNILRLKAVGDLERAARETEEALRREEVPLRLELFRELADIRA